jgi:hypothetical protein
VSGYRERLFKFVESQSVELSFSERIAPAKGLSHGGKITLLSGMQPAEEFPTLVHEIAHLCGARIYVALISGSVRRQAVRADKHHITCAVEFMESQRRSGIISS